MSPSAELQKLVYDTLVADAGVAAIVGDRIYDRMPTSGDYPCITFGPSDYTEDDSECITGRIEALQLDCWVQSDGRLRPCRELADAVKSALHEADLSMAVNALVRIRVDGVRVFADQDGVTAHGVVTVEATIEET